MKRKLYEDDVVNKSSLMEQAKEHVVWPEEGSIEARFTFMLSCLEYWMKHVTNLQHVTEKDQLMIVFNVMPGEMTRFYLHRFVAARSFCLGKQGGPGSPFQFLDLRNDKQFKDFVESFKAVTNVIVQHLRYLRIHHGENYAWDAIVGAKPGVPMKSLCVEMSHLFPTFRQNAKKVLTVEVKKETPKKETPKKETPRKETKLGAKNRKGDRTPTATPRTKAVCWNCQSDAHRAGECTKQCKRCPLDVGEVDGSFMHRYFDCPKRDKEVKK
jgi:hypothetical protein